MSFLERNKNRIIVIGVTIILIIIMGLTNEERDSITPVERIVGNTLSPINKVTFNFRKKTSDFISIIKNLSGILEENESLKAEVARLEELNREQENLIGKSEYLKRERELEKVTEYNLVSAQVISKEPGNWYDRFVIDKGSKDGIKKNDTVIQGVEIENGVIKEGIVGRVSDVTDNSAKVISVIDELNKISFKVLRTQDGGVIKGNVSNKLEGLLFDSNADVIVGDRLYTSGLGKIFNKDIYIGEVEEIIELEEERQKQVIVKPSVDFKKIYKVFVIVD